MKAVLTTRELADAIGVSESSLKRWTDDGKIRASRTAGGHRRIPLGEAIRFVRASGATVLRPDILGMTEMGQFSADALERGASAEGLYDALQAGDAPRVRGLVMSLYLAGWSVAEIFDGPVRDAMHRLGDLWRHDEAGVFVEHRATDLCIQALHQLRAAQAEPAGDAPVAVGGGHAKDPYLIPTMMASMVLVDVGFRAVNLGPDTPMTTLETAVREQKAMLGWLSVSVAVEAGRLRKELEELVEQLDELGANLVLGGQGVPERLRVSQQGMHFARSMGELEAFARGVLASQPSAAGER